MPAPKVVLDTNVLLQAMMGSRAAWAVIEACKQGRLQLVYSQKLAYEVEEKAFGNARVKERIMDADFSNVDKWLVRFGRCARDPKLGVPYTRITHQGSDEVPNDSDDQFVFALAQSTGAVIITSDRDFEHAHRLGIPAIGLYDAAAALREPQGIQVTLADRYGRSELSLTR